MSGSKTDILWSCNHEDQYVTFGTDLSLFKVEAYKDGVVPKGQVTQISEETYASLLSVNSDNQYMKCLAWYPKPQPDNLLAVGLANGRVVLTSFGKAGEDDPHRLVGKEFSLKHARPCNCLSWNQVDSSLLAEGLDKYRADYSILIWDVQAKATSDMGFTTGKQFSSIGTDLSTISKPCVELGSSESTMSLSWFYHSPKTLVTGMNHKFLRIYDLRDISRPMSVAQTKAVYGLKVDPHFEHRLASYMEGKVTVWDTRNFDKPVLAIPETKPVVKLGWSPTRCDLLACLVKESPIVKLYDIQRTSMGADDLEPAVIERFLQVDGQQIVSAFDWHPTHENRMITVFSGGTVKDVKIFERIALTWSPDIYLTWACGRQMKQCHSIKVCREANEDISIKMKRRALKGYGLKRELWLNEEMVAEDARLKNLWDWLDYVRNLQDDGRSIISKAQTKSLPRFQGVQCILRSELGSGSGITSWCDVLGWQNIDGHKIRSQRKVYKSEARSRALLLCGWTADKDNQTNDLIINLESAGEYERAAAVAVFRLKLKQAIQVLNKGASASSTRGGDLNLNMVAMALSGFSDDKPTLWREMCSSLSAKLNAPYLRAMFYFLTSDNDHYDEVLNECEMEVQDRAAFACMYLSDSKLLEYVVTLSKSLIDKGSLDGILLTGLTGDGLDLLQRYVDITCDIQTACLVLMQALPSQELSRDQRVRVWIESYRELLDTWQLWHQRAEFDVQLNACDSNWRPQAQIFVSCSFCGRSISYNTLPMRSRLYPYSGVPGNRSKKNSCPPCRKPLPRCALCLTHMGTAAGSGKSKSAMFNTNDESQKLSKFSEWFTWCQTCRHGGHADHITTWFKEHTECPVTGCTCKCTSLDAMGSVLTDSRLQTGPTLSPH